MSKYPTIETPEIPNDIKVYQHYVEFHSPGTFISEVSRKAIPDWNVEAAVKLSGSIIERHGARPFGFRFLTMARKKEEMDSYEISRSNFFFLGGKVRTREEVEQDNLPDERVLRSNMRANNIPSVVENGNSYKTVRPLDEGDVVLDLDFSQIQEEPAST